GGRATRLTTHPGPESQPAISPDGKTIAFLANYEDGGAGAREAGEVYTMPIAGGLPTRRTWGGPAGARTTFVGWIPDGKLIYGTREFASLPSVQLAVQDLATNTVTPVPLYEADQGSYTADGKTLVFTRFPFQGSNTRRYKGGYIQQLWRWDGGDAEAAPLTTDYEGTSKDAMVINDRVYFASDRDTDAAAMNIWSCNLEGKDLRQHTRHTDFEVSFPSADPATGKIAYQCGADLWVLDTKSGADTKLDIQLVSDFDQMREQWLKKPASAISNLDISPDGDRVVIVARGRVFVAPARQGRIVEATRDQGVRHRNAGFMPGGGDGGKQLLVSSDRSGEVEFWTTPANGVNEAEERKQLTKDAKVLRWEAVPSPAGTMIAHHDKDLQLWLTTVADGTTRLIATTRLDNFGELAWSGDSKWLAYVEQAPNTNRQIKLYNVADGRITAATTDRFESFSPRFSPDGKWLYFLSDRTIDSTVPSPWGPMNPAPNFENKTKVYQLALKAGTRSPWQPKDEVLAAEEAKKAEKKKEEEKKREEEKKKDEPKKDETSPGQKPGDDQPKASDPAKDAKKDEPKKDDAKKDEKKVTAVEIDLDGLAARITEAPVPAGNYTRLMVNDKALFFGAYDAGGEDGPGNLTLKAIAITNDKPEVKTVAAGVRLYELSADGKKMLIHKAAPSDTIAVIDAAPAPAEIDRNAVDLSGWSMSVVPGMEWRQMYADAWRLLRDYFYATNMHGADWPKVRDKYAPLLERIRSRSDLNDVLAQMTAELSTLHHFVYGGDLRASQDRAALGHLGADLVRDEAAGGYRVQHVYDHDPDDPAQCPPLAKPTVNVKDGDVITHVNGVPTLSLPSIAVLLRNQVGKQVLIHVKPKEGEERDAIVNPVSAAAAADLRYNQWEFQRRQTVEKDAAGQIGYVHLRAMGKADIAQWAKNFYPVFDRQGLIIDVRRNNGGNIDSWILSTLLRKPWMFWNQHAGRAPAWNMQYAFRGHVVVICDGFTASDGEAFSEGFKRLGLGKVIGTRTWGGEVWLSSSNKLVDDGLASAGEYGVFGPSDKGEMVWLVEGRGVEPDITVDNPPHATFKGEDAQLKAAIEHLQKLIKEKPVTLPDVPALPDKQFKKP
ncbi:MAG: PDZ domain-containing protein, partial [Phycisphaerales bacterium]|nr:PDZ domain-containing protein [Phycisphaerales bacterium]